MPGNVGQGHPLDATSQIAVVKFLTNDFDADPFILRHVQEGTPHFRCTITKATLNYRCGRSPSKRDGGSGRRYLVIPELFDAREHHDCIESRNHITSITRTYS